MKDDRIGVVKVVKLRGESVAEIKDVVLVERPLTIKVDEKPFVTVMYTPGDEMELAAGLLHAEGIINSKSDLATMRFCPVEREDVVEVTLAAGRKAIAGQRLDAGRRVSRSSCGICGRELLDDISSFTLPVDNDDIQVSAGRLVELEAGIGVEYQRLFGQTGAAHSAALLDSDGNVLSFAEDVGRHNALDKVIGRIVLRPPKKGPAIALLSSRASFEMVQKVARAQIPIACFASAPTGLAVELAEKLRVTLVAFLRPTGLNVYTHSRRIIFEQRSGGP